MFRFPTPELVEAQGEEIMTEAEIIIKHWNDGLTSTQIAEVLNTTRSAVAGKISRLRASGVFLHRRMFVNSEGRVVAKSCAEKEPKPKKQKAEQLSFDVFFAPSELLPAAPVVEEPLVVGGVSLFDLKTFDCHYVIGRADDMAVYCGKRAHRRSMCREHHARCYYMPKKG